MASTAKFLLRDLSFDVEDGGEDERETGMSNSERGATLGTLWRNCGILARMLLCMSCRMLLLILSCNAEVISSTASGVAASPAKMALRIMLCR
jgi:hypothetical protein